ncbi:glycosyltransferase [Aeromonas veronii]|uniref:glycosyltransferase n=1 Tax=Aeromonas veronii TaxID=654 RepID=UPI00111629C3|nr:glycosyltransferase [Aeromonas veronii]
MNRIKNWLKKNSFILSLYELIFKRPIINVFNKANSKKALLSYSTYHFKKNNYKAHSNYQESVAIAEIMDSLGFNVDVVNNNREARLSLNQYDVIIGEGIPLYQSIVNNISGKKIYYATGSHPWQCTQASLHRLSEFAKRYGSVPLKSTRVQDYRWGVAASCADSVICIGNEQTKQSFLDNGVSQIELIRPSFHQASMPYTRTLDDIATARKTALWFGSYGLLHKGLDIAIEAFRCRPEWTLHVCGYTNAEQDFLDSLDVPGNVIIHGFLNVDSDFFSELAARCLYVILPSCSEGIATSVITAMGRGAMIPIVTKECGVDIYDFGVNINALDSDSIRDSLNFCDSFSDSELLARSIAAYNNANTMYTFDAYKKDMMSILTKLI